MFKAYLALGADGKVGFEFEARPPSKTPAKKRPVLLMPLFQFQPKKRPLIQKYLLKSLQQKNLWERVINNA
jgi:hypothetical protein